MEEKKGKDRRRKYVGEWNAYMDIEYDILADSLQGDCALRL
jgi:hypothetical protein